MPEIPKNDSCLIRTAAAGQPKTASGITVFLLEEIGDARLRFSQLKQHLDEATQLVEKSGKREHLFEVAGHLLHGIPEIVAKMGTALDTAALAAARLDYEEIKDQIRPAKVEQLERALKDVRVRRVRRRGFEDTAMNAKSAAELLDRIADEVESSGRIPTGAVMSLVGLLEGGTRTASASSEKLAGHFRTLSSHLTKMLDKGQPPSRVRLASHLRHLVGEGLDTTSAQMASEIYQTSNSREDVMDGFKQHNPSMSQEDLNEVADNWEKNKDVVKDKHAVAPSKSDWQKALRKDEQDLKWFQDALKALRAGENVENLTETGAEETIDGLQAVISNKKRMLKKMARFQEGKPADPTKNMDQGDKKEWQDSKDQHGDKFKKDKKAGMDAPILAVMKKAYDAGIKGQDADAEREMAGAMKELERSMQTAMVRAGGSSAGGSPAGLMANLSASLWEFAYYWGGTVAASTGRTADWKTTEASGMPDPMADQAMRSRFEEGKPADPTEDMSPEDAQEWKSNTEEHKDKFKGKEAATLDQVRSWKAELTEDLA